MAARPVRGSREQLLRRCVDAGREPLDDRGPRVVVPHAGRPCPRLCATGSYRTSDSPCWRPATTGIRAGSGARAFTTARASMTRTTRRRLERLIRQAKPLPETQSYADAVHVLSSGVGRQCLDLATRPSATISTRPERSMRCTPHCIALNPPAPNGRSWPPRHTCSCP